MSYSLSLSVLRDRVRSYYSASVIIIIWFVICFVVLVAAGAHLLERSVSAVTRERAFRRQSTDHRVKAVAHESMTTAVLAFASGPCKVPVSGLESSPQKLEHEHHGRDVVTRAAAQRPAH